VGVLIVELQLALFRYAYTKDLELPSCQFKENRLCKIFCCLCHIGLPQFLVRHQNALAPSERKLFNAQLCPQSSR
jgi:hypothetical protein